MYDPTYTWAISQNQIEQLICASYEEIFNEVCTWNLEREFADDNNDALRRYIIHTVVRRNHPAFNWPAAITFKVRRYGSEEEIEDDIGILLGPSELILPWPMSIGESDEQRTCRDASEVVALKDEDQNNHLSGQLIADMVGEFVRNILLPALEEDPAAPAQSYDPDQIRETLVGFGLELPDNLRFETIPDTLDYSIKYVSDEKGSSWVVELPAPTQELIDENPNNAIVSQFAEKCPIPCLE